MKTTDVLLIARRRNDAKWILWGAILFISVLMFFFLALTISAIKLMPANALQYFMIGIIFLIASYGLVLWMFKFALGWIKEGIADG